VPRCLCAFSAISYSTVLCNYSTVLPSYSTVSCSYSTVSCSYSIDSCSYSTVSGSYSIDSCSYSTVSCSYSIDSCSYSIVLGSKSHYLDGITSEYCIYSFLQLRIMCAQLNQYKYKIGSLFLGFMTFTTMLYDECHFTQTFS